MAARFYFSSLPSRHGFEPFGLGKFALPCIETDEHVGFQFQSGCNMQYVQRTKGRLGRMVQAEASPCGEQSMFGHTATHKQSLDYRPANPFNGSQGLCRPTFSTCCKSSNGILSFENCQS